MFRTYATLTLSATLLFAAGQFQILTSSLPDATAGVSYNQAIATTGGTCRTDRGTASSSIDSGVLPPGLSVTSPAGVQAWSIQGVPSTGGTYQFALHLQWKHNGVSPFDPDCTDQAVATLSITVQGSTTPPGTLTIGRNQVNATYHLAHFPPASESVQVGSSSGSPVPFTAQATTSSSGPWLSVTPSSGSTPSTLSLSFSVSGLAAGVYTGAVTVSSGGTVQATIGVTLTVVADSGIVLQAAPAALTFTTSAGGAPPAAQSVQISAGVDQVIFLSDISAPPTGKWLTISPTGAVTPATLSVAVDPKNLAAGTYAGTITLHLSGLSNVAQTIPVTFNVTAANPLPSINSNAVLNAASLGAAIAPGTWVTIFGSNLSATTRSWQTADFVGGKLPTSLDNVSVTIDGKAAVVSYVSPTQINALAPDDSTTGLVFAQVKAPAGTSGSVLVLQQTAAPAFFQFRAASTNYVAGTHADNSLLAGTALLQQGVVGTPAKPGEIIVMYGTGFGATQPLISATAPVTVPLSIANPQDLRVRIGGVDAAVVFAGLVAPGLYQFNVAIPNVPDGDQTVVADLRGLTTQSGLLLAVQR